jgi:ectoine hydroxylase-related dioxygenase (phytanoyl-CoA dioxygenase family)
MESERMFENDYPLTDEQIQSYRQNGFVQLPDVVTGSELERMREAITGAVKEEIRTDQRTFAEKSSYEQVFIQRINLWARHPSLEEFILCRRFGNLAARLSGYQVRVFHDHALYKEARTGTKTPWHQDTHYWPHQQKGHQLSLWLALVDVPIKSGCLAFLPGTHGIKDVPSVNLSGSVELRQTAPQLNGRKAVSVPLKAGSCTFHNGLTFHYAGPNRSDWMREGLAIIYMPDGTTYSGQKHVMNFDEFAPGDRLQGKRFPLVSNVPDLKTIQAQPQRECCPVG